MAPVSTQPLPNSMNAYSVELRNDEKSSNQCQIHLGSKGQCSCAADPARHRACHQARLGRLLLPIALLLLAVGATLIISCVSDIDLFDLVSLGADVSGSPLGKRQSTSSGQSSFTQNKCEFISRCTVIVVVVTKGLIVYLIIVFVGLFLVLIAGIMLSYWCCKGKVPSCQDVSRTESLHDFPNVGSFENPLCCPCYLCACCGGLGKLSPFQLHGCRLLCVVSLFRVHWMWVVCGWTGGSLMQLNSASYPPLMADTQ